MSRVERIVLWVIVAIVVVGALEYLLLVLGHGGGSTGTGTTPTG